MDSSCSNTMFAVSVAILLCAALVEAETVSAQSSQQPVTRLQNFCIAMADPEHGQVECSNGTTYGSVCSTICDDGYVVRGSVCRRCQSNGEWSGFESTCRPRYGCIQRHPQKKGVKISPKFVKRSCCPAGEDGNMYNPSTHGCCFAGKLRWLIPKQEELSYDCDCCQEHKSECWTCCDEEMPTGIGLRRRTNVTSSETEFKKSEGISEEQSIFDTPQINFKVVGGGPASFEARRRNAYLVYERDIWGNRPIPGFPPICGGVLIHASWVLTARHCITNDMCDEKIIDTSPLRVIVGKNTTSILSENDGQARSVSMAICHPHYCRNRAKPDLNDIAIIRLSKPIDMSDSRVALARLPPQGDAVQPWTSCLLTGWGTKRRVTLYPYPDFERWVKAYIRATPTSLQEVNVPVVPVQYCRGGIRPCQMCAGLPRKDGCSSDSGSPLFCDGEPFEYYLPESKKQRETQFIVHGIFNSGVCGTRSNVPGVYARVSFYTDWIEENIKAYS